MCACLAFRVLHDWPTRTRRALTPASILPTCSLPPNPPLHPHPTIPTLSQPLELGSLEIGINYRYPGRRHFKLSGLSTANTPPPPCCPAADLPTSPDELAQRLSADPAGTPLGQLCAAVTRFFASADCLAAAFWPRDRHAPPPSAASASGEHGAASTSGGSSSKVAPGSSSGGQAAPTHACPLDFTAVAALYDAVLGAAVPPPAASSSATAATASAASAAAPEPGSSSRPSENGGGAAGGTGELSPSTSAAATAAGGAGGLSPAGRQTAATASTSATATASATASVLRPRGHSAALCAALTAGAEGLLAGAGGLPAALNPGLPRQLAVLLACPLLDRSEHHE